MNGWWIGVFWFLLIPLIIVEIIIFLKSRKFFWLVYALSVFTYIVSVTYTIDVFDLGRNSVILILLASAALMFLIGRQMGKKPKKRISSKEKWSAIGIASFLVLLFVISVIFGRLSESVAPVPGISAADIFVRIDDKGLEKPYPANGIVVLKRTLSNSFILPVPVVQRQYRACLQAEEGLYPLDPLEFTTLNEEVGPGKTKTVDVRVQQYRLYNNQMITPQEVLVFTLDRAENSWVPCETLQREPTYRIPVE